MRKEIDMYLDQVCAYIRCRDVHAGIRAELRTHMEELTDVYEEKGQSTDEAVARAIAAMGDPEVIGRQFDRVHRPKTDWMTVVLVVLLMGCGLVTMASLDRQPGDWPWKTNMLAERLASVGIGVLVCWLCARLDYRRLRMSGGAIFLATWLLILPIFWVGVYRFGMPMYDLGFIKFDIIRASPFLFLLAVASLLTRWSWQKDGWKVPLFIWYALPALLYLKTPSQSTFVLYTIGFITLALLSGANKRWVGGVIAIVSGMMLCRLTMFPYEMKRLLGFWRPFADPLGMGYQVVQSIQAIREAGMWGHGFGVWLRNLPNTQEDFVFAYIVYAFGWVSGVGITVLVAALFVRLYRMMLVVREPFGRMLGGTICVLFVVLFSWNILMTIGLMPVASIPLPFVAHGTTAFLVHLAVLGLLIGIHRRRDMMMEY